MTENKTAKAAIPADVAAAAKDEAQLVEAIAAAGFPGRLPTAVIEAARKVVNGSKLAATAAEEELAKVAAQAAGATGLASHDRNRVAKMFASSGDVVTASAQAAGPRAATARSLVWFVTALQTADAELVAASDTKSASK